MKPSLTAGLMLALALTTDARAHRLDEYLQAGRVSVASDGLSLSLHLTPGVAIVPQVLHLIDADRDGRCSKNEAASYAKSVLQDLRVALDGRILALKLIDVTLPEVEEINAGLGMIRIRAIAPWERLSGGSHTVTLANGHLPEISVYLVNALVPKDPAVRITKQIRDELQRNYRLLFEIAPDATQEANTGEPGQRTGP